MKYFIYKNRYPIAIFIIITLLILLRVSFIQNTFFRVFSPIEGFLYQKGSSLSRWVSSAIHVQDVITQGEELRKKNADLLLENSMLKEAQSENAILKEYLQFIDENPLESKHTIARVIGLNEIDASYFYMNKGTNEGIIVGLPILTRKGVLIGKIHSVSTHTSEGQFLIGRQSVVSAMVQNQSQTTQIIRGEHGLSLRMEFIPQDEIIVEDDTVITSGLEQNIPKGLLIGTIERIVTQENEPFKSAYISTPIDYRKEGIVMILLPNE